MELDYNDIKMSDKEIQIKYNLKEMERIANKKICINKFELKVFRDYFEKINSKAIRVKIKDEDEYFYIIPYGIIDFDIYEKISYYYVIGINLFKGYIEQNNNKYNPLYILNRAIEIHEINRKEFHENAEKKLNKIIEQYETSVEFTDNMAPDDYGMVCTASKAEAREKFYKNYGLKNNSYTSTLIKDDIDFGRYKRNLKNNSEIKERKTQYIKRS